MAQTMPRPVAAKVQAERLDPANFDESQGCGSLRKHARVADPHAFLRRFEGRYPETFQRVLDPAELRKRPPAELRLMRNEVFARYGYRFRDRALLDHFGKVKGYWHALESVDAFLSDVERQNVALLAAAEREAAPPPAGEGGR